MNIEDLTKEVLIEEYVNQRCTPREIAKKYNCAKTSVTYRLKKFDIYIRKRTEIYKDLHGQKFGKLTITNKYPKRDKKTGDRIWHCICECGEESWVKSSKLSFGHTKSCGCLVHRKGPENKKWEGFGEISKSFWTRTTTNAQIRGHEVSIDIEYIWKLFLKQDKKCALTGLELEPPVIERGKFTASLDRINSSLGYIEGNVQWVHKDINLMKNILDQDRFIELCELVVKNQDKNENN